MMTSTQFIAAVEDLISMPVNQTRFDEDALMRFGDSVLRTHILPLILGVRESYLEAWENYTVTGDNSYAVPARATGRAVISVNYWPAVDEGEYKLIPIKTHEAHEYTTAGGVPTHFYLSGDRIYVLPVPTDTTHEVRVLHDRKPSLLTDVANTAQITAINTSTGALTCSSVPTTVITASTPVDLIQGVAGNRPAAIDLTPTNVSSTIVTLTAADLPEGLAVGDYIALAGYSPVLQIPEELHDLTVLAVALKICPSIGDLELTKELKDQFKTESTSMTKLYVPRVKGSTQAIVPRQGLLRGRRGGRQPFYPQDPLT
jgi:hypothetical protein